MDMTGILSKATLVIGVVTRDRRSEWTMFELGLAWSTGRRVLLFVHPAAKVQIPEGIKGMLVVRSSSNNREAIAFALDQLLAAPSQQSRTGQKEAPGHVLADKADHYLSELNQAAFLQQGHALEALIGRVLKDAGVEVVASREIRDVGVDFAVWSDGLHPSVGNPLLIEVKTALRGQAEVRQAASTLSQRVRTSGTRWGLLLYSDGPSATALEQSMPPNVLVLDVPSMLMMLRQQPFSKIVNDLRNRRVHGVAY
jgi:hypothetical protein